MHQTQPKLPCQRSMTILSMFFLALAALLATACGESAVSAAASEDNVAAAPQTGVVKSNGVQAAKAAASIDKESFRTVVPEGWEILADDVERMGLMTLAKKGTGGSQGVYLKFEKGFSGDPMAAVEKFAGKYQGSPAVASNRNGIEWAHTSFVHNGIEQSLNITAHEGIKVSFTVMGQDYETNPGVKAVFDNLELF